MAYMGVIQREQPSELLPLALHLGRVEEAEGHYRTGLEWGEEVRFPVEQGRCLQGLAEVAERRQSLGIDIDRTAISKIESGKLPATNLEILAIY